MLAVRLGQLCDMPCSVLKIGHKLVKFDHGVCFVCNDCLLLNKKIGQVSLILMGLLLWVLWKRTNEDIFLQPSTKEATQKSNLQDTYSLVPYFTWFNLNDKFNACSICLKCILEQRWKQYQKMHDWCSLDYLSTCSVYISAVVSYCALQKCE